VSFAAITLCVASQRGFIVVIVVVYFVIDSARKFLDSPSYCVAGTTEPLLVKFSTGGLK